MVALYSRSGADQSGTSTAQRCTRSAPGYVSTVFGMRETYPGEKPNPGDLDDAPLSASSSHERRSGKPNVLLPRRDPVVEPGAAPASKPNPTGVCGASGVRGSKPGNADVGDWRGDMRPPLTLVGVERPASWPGGVERPSVVGGVLRPVFGGVLRPVLGGVLRPLAAAAAEAASAAAGLLCRVASTGRNLFLEDSIIERACSFASDAASTVDGRETDEAGSMITYASSAGRAMMIGVVGEDDKGESIGLKSATSMYRAARSCGFSVRRETVDCCCCCFRCKS